MDQTMKIQYKFWKGLGRHFGGFWEGLGLHSARFWTVLGFSWALLAASWPFFGRLKSNFFRALAQDGLQEAFWIDLGLILEGIWEDLGRIWEDLGEIFFHFWLHLGRFVQEAFEMIWGGF